MRLVALGDCGTDRYEGTGQVCPGGCALNLASSARAVTPEDGLDIRLVTALGSDAEGAALALLIETGFPGSSVLTLPGRTPVQKVRLKADGERELCGYEAGILESWRLPAAQAELVRQADLVTLPLFRQFENVVQQVLRLERRGGLAVDLMDLSDYHSLDRLPAGILEAATVLFAGLVTHHSGPAMESLRRWAGGGGRTAVVTLGKDGAVGFCGTERQRVEAEKVGQVIDTTGAGDTFAGAFLAHRLRGSGLAAAMAAGSAAAAATVQRLGGTTGLRWR